jgi:hypothetical protein
MGEFKENAKMMGCSTIWVIWGAVIVIAVSLLGLAFYGVQLNLQRRAQTESVGFIQAKIEQMSKDFTQFQEDELDLAKNANNQKVVDANHADQMGVVKDMWNAYDQIPQDSKDAVPTDLLNFLNSHSRNWRP